MLASGHDVHNLKGEKFSRISEKCSMYKKNGLIRLIPDNWLFPEGFVNIADHLYKFQVKATDINIITYPKCGTSWTQEIVWTMKHNPNLDNPDADLPILSRSIHLEADMLRQRIAPNEPQKYLKPVLDNFYKHCPSGNPALGMNWQIGAAQAEPRILKCHLPLSLMPPNMLDDAKVIYVARNPADVICSFYHHCRLYRPINYTGTIEEFVEDFLNGDVMYSPYPLHVKEAWDKRHHPNMHFILYEDMKADTMKELRKLDEFLGTNLTDQQLENVKQYTSFSEMKNRDNLIGLERNKNVPFINQDVLKADGGFFRKGVVGEGKKSLSPDLLAQIDEWSKKYFDFGLTFG